MEVMADVPWTRTGAKRVVIVLIRVPSRLKKPTVPGTIRGVDIVEAKVGGP
jgi:hypothetical protein